MTIRSITPDLERYVHIPSGSVSLGARLDFPPAARSLVIFAHGAGSSRFSPRNNFVADVLAAHGLGVLLMDLLGPDESSHKKESDIDLLAARIMSARTWVHEQENLRDVSIGLFGVSSGAAAVLEVASRLGPDIGAVVCRGGRTDLVENDLSRIVSPTLLIVAGRDSSAVEMNKAAISRMTCVRNLEVVEGANYLFEVPGTLEQVAYLANTWFAKYLLKSPQFGNGRS